MQMPEATTVTVSVLEDLTKEIAIEAKTAGTTRLSYFVKLAENTTESEFRDALRDYRKMHEKDKVAAVRASEFQAIYYGGKNHAKYDGMGYNQAVQHAREHLKAAGLRTNGKPILSEEEQQANRDKNDRQKAAREAAKKVDFGAADALDKLASQTALELAAIQAARAEKGQQANMARIDATVTSILEVGTEYADALFVALGKKLGYDMETDPELTDQEVIDLMSKAA